MPVAAIVSNTLSRYDGRLIKISELLADIGYEVHLLGFQALNENMPGAQFPKTMSRLSWMPDRVASTLYYRGQKRAILNALTRHRPEFIICADIIALEVCAAAKPAIGAKLVYDAHEYFRDEFPDEDERRQWVERIETTYAPAVDYFITVNESLGKLYAKDKAGFPDPIVVRNAAKRRGDIEYDGRLHDAAQIDRDKNIVLFHGGITPLRGITLLCEAAPLLSADWVVVLMGTSTPPEWVPLPDEKLRYVDPVPQSELHKWVAGASLGAVLYEDGALNQKYCSPNKIWEYPAASVPILASDLPEISRLVRRFGCGIIVPDDDRTAEGIARHVSSLTQAQLKSLKVGCKAAHAEENWENEMKRLRSIF